MDQVSAGQKVAIIGTVNARYEDGSVTVMLKDGQSVLTSRGNLDPVADDVPNATFRKPSAPVSKKK